MCLRPFICCLQDMGYRASHNALCACGVVCFAVAGEGSCWSRLPQVAVTRDHLPQVAIAGMGRAS